MSDYGPPGGPHPGRPQEPWPGSQPHPDEQPTQEWVRPESWDNAPPQSSYGQPEAGYPHHAESPPPRYGDQQGSYAQPRPYEPGRPAGGPDPAWSVPAPVPPGRSDRRSSRTPILVLVVVLALLVFGGGGTALYLLGSGDESKTPQPSAQPSAPPVSSAHGTTAKPSTSTPAPQSSTDARFAKVGQCVKNEGAESSPRLVITRCTAKTYQVLARFDGATTGENDAKTKCGKVTGYTDWYFFNSELDVLDFVLCLKLR